MITDGEDPDSTDVSDYIDLLKSLQPEPWLVTATVFAPKQAQPPVGCSYGPATAGRSTRLAAFADALDLDAHVDICEPRWTSYFPAGCVAFGYQTRFFLSSSPDPSEQIHVAVDGVDLAHVDAYGGVVWAYDSTAVAIDVSAAWVPEPRSTVTVRNRSGLGLCEP